MENYIVECINSLCRRYLDMDTNLTFTLNYDSSAKNEEIQAKAYQTSLSSGVLTLNDIRGEMGQPLYDMAEAVDRFMRIEGVGMMEKSGGKSGDWKRPAEG